MGVNSIENHDLRKKETVPKYKLNDFDCNVYRLKPLPLDNDSK